MAETLTEKLTKTREGMRLYQQERASQELMDLVCEHIAKGGRYDPNVRNELVYDEVDALVGWEAGRTVGILDGEARITLDDASDIFHALGKSLHFSVGPLETCPG